MAKTIPNEEKVFMVSKSTNTTYSGSASLKAMQEWYTMEDVANTVKPYKVFTALLTQSGGNFTDNNNYIMQDGMVAGRSYHINSNVPVDQGGTDFIVSGASSNEPDTWFISNGQDPLWGNQDGDVDFNTGAPVVTVLENTIGNVWFSYNSPGQYVISSDGLFTNNKTSFQSNSYFESDNASIVDCITNIRSNTINNIVIWSWSRADSAVIDNELYNTPIEIRVYN